MMLLEDFSDSLAIRNRRPPISRVNVATTGKMLFCAAQKAQTVPASQLQIARLPPQKNENNRRQALEQINKKLFLSSVCHRSSSHQLEKARTLIACSKPWATQAETRTATKKDGQQGRPFSTLREDRKAYFRLPQKRWMRVQASSRASVEVA
jgi:hypothetical protein